MCEMYETNRDRRKIYLAQAINDCIEDFDLRNLKILLSQDDADPNIIIPDRQYSPMHAVAGIENEDFASEAVIILLEKGGNPNILGDEHITPLHIAACWNHASVIQILLESGAHISVKDDTGKTALDYAEENNCVAAVAILTSFKERMKADRHLQTSTLSSASPLLQRLRKIKAANPNVAIGRRRSRRFFRSSLFQNKSRLSFRQEHKPRLSSCQEEVETQDTRNSTCELIDLTQEGSEWESEDNSEDGAHFLGDVKSVLENKNHRDVVTESNLEGSHARNETDCTSSSSSKIDLSANDIGYGHSVSGNVHSNGKNDCDSESSNYQWHQNYSKNDSQLKQESIDPFLTSEDRVSSLSLLSFETHEQELSEESQCTGVKPKHPRCSLRKSLMQSSRQVPKILITKPSGESSTICEDVKDISNITFQKGFSSKIPKYKKNMQPMEDLSKRTDKVFIIPTEERFHKVDKTFISKRMQEWVNSIKSNFTEGNGNYMKTSDGEVSSTSSGNNSLYRSVSKTSQDTASTSEVSGKTEKLNIAALGSKLASSSSTNSSVNTCTSECYVYTDEENGIVLLEERWKANPVLQSDVPHSDQSGVSGAVVKTDTESCDTNSLRRELACRGILYGPITATTKKIYQKKLARGEKLNLCKSKPDHKYSLELMRSLRSSGNLFFLAPGSKLERDIEKEFSVCGNKNSGSKHQWREGCRKTSFTYLLLDPRVTLNLPWRAPEMSQEVVWSLFLSSVFYVGKGKRSRPFSHLYEASLHWKKDTCIRSLNKKVQKILDIWSDGCGVICLHIFQNVIPVEAYTREAAMIDAIGLSNLCNVRRSEYYGKAATWSHRDQRILGVFLLHKALQIFLSEGERHIRPWDIG